MRVKGEKERVGERDRARVEREGRDRDGERDTHTEV